MEILDIYEKIDILRTSISNSEKDYLNKKQEQKWVLRGLPIIRRYNERELSNVMTNLVDVLKTIPD